MHSPVKKAGTVHPDLLVVSALAKHLLSASSRFENAALHSKAASQDGLRCLATLDKPTRMSLPILAPEAPVQAASAKAAPVTPPALAPAAYGSHKPEYKAGLGDRTVVDALLDYHSRKRPASGSHAPASGFRPTHAAQVAAQPKSAARPEAAHQHGTTRVFRPRGD